MGTFAAYILKGHVDRFLQLHASASRVRHVGGLDRPVHMAGLIEAA